MASRKENFNTNKCELDSELSDWPSPEERTRHKRWTSRVKTGCITCRARRVKCDEAKPACKRCTSTGRKCDGYANPPSVSSLVKLTAAASSLAHGQPGPAVTPACIQPTGKELEMFHFFRTHVAAQAAGAFDLSFWTVDLMQATLLHPAIWHATAAVAAMHKRYSIPFTADAQAARDRHYSLALNQYNASIRHLVGIAGCEGDPSPVDKEALLMASVLFTGLCSLRGDHRQAFVHMRNGLRLFHQWRPWESRSQPRAPGGVLPIDSLITLFNRLDSQALNLMDDAMRATWEPNVYPRQTLTTPFTSATEAYFEFELLFNGLLELMQRREFLSMEIVPNPLHKVRDSYRGSFHVWAAKFSNFQASPFVKPADENAILSLRIWQLTAQIALDLDVTNIGMCWDEFHAQFERIVDLTEQLLGNQYAGSQADARPRAPVFSFAAQTCEPLYLVAESCRNSVTRRRAIELLRRWPRREGLWDSVLAATVGEAIMLREESGAEADRLRGGDCECVKGVYICAGHRVLDTDLEFFEEGHGSIMLKTVNDVRHGKPGQTLHLRW